VTPAPVPTGSPPAEGTGYGLPPGLDTTGVTDVVRLARGHAAAATETTHVWERSATTTHYFGNSSANASTSEVLRFHNESTYHRHVDRYEAVIDGELRYLEDYEEYVTGTVGYRSWRTDDGRTVRRTEASDLTPGYPATVVADLRRYLALESARVSRVNASDGRYYEVVGTRSVLPRFGRLEYYRARARIRADGLVTRLDVRFNATMDGDYVRGRYNFTYRQIGTASVTEPDWVPSENGSLTGIDVNGTDARRDG
jgi:hypothetical protein